jgi:hypothetical protein
LTKAPLCAIIEVIYDSEKPTMWIVTAYITRNRITEKQDFIVREAKTGLDAITTAARLHGRLGSPVETSYTVFSEGNKILDRAGFFTAEWEARPFDETALVTIL